MSNARELAAARQRLWAGLTPTEIRAVNWAAFAHAAAAAIDAGWSGHDVGSAGLELNGAQNIGAVIVANIRALATNPPPSTPTPPRFVPDPRPICDHRAGAKAVRHALALAASVGAT